MFKKYRPSLYDVAKLEWTNVNMLAKDADVSKFLSQQELLEGQSVKDAETGEDTYIMYYDDTLKCYRLIIDLGEYPDVENRFWVYLSLDAVVDEDHLDNSFKSRYHSEEYKFYRKWN